MREIANSLEVFITSIVKDIEAMRQSGDPGLIEAEKQRDKLRARTPPTKTELEMKQALEEMGLTAGEVRTQYLDWFENAGPDDSLLRPRVNIQPGA